MNPFPIVVSYYTEQTPYEWEAKNLIASCNEWGVECCVEPICSFGSWEMNCAYKPFFLYQKLEELQRPLFWVDADAVFLQKPTPLEAFSADVAVRINQNLSRDHPSYIISGGVYVNDTENAKKVLKRWAKTCIDRLSDPKREVELWDQMALRDVLLEVGHIAEVGSLPPGYVMIFGHPEDEEKIQERVIGHFQASRRLKKMINDPGCQRSVF